MDQINEIIFDRIILKKNYPYLKNKFSLTKDHFEQRFKTIKIVKELYFDNLIVKSLKLFQSKVQADQKIYEWNKRKKSRENKKEYAFSHYSRIDEYGKSIKAFENFDLFFNDLKRQYFSQTKLLLQSELKWIGKNNEIKANEYICYYCGISEKVLDILYNDSNSICKTKRNRGAWFELDRKNAMNNYNVYNENNIVLCCYFCNNHKSDVISPEDMRLFFGEKMFSYLISQFNKLPKNK